MRVAVLAVLLAGCPNNDPPVMPDAGLEPDGGLSIPGGGEYWPCFLWDRVSPTLEFPIERCAPGCSNYGSVGVHSSSTDTSCEIADNVFCPKEFINGQPWTPDVSCCVYVPSGPERVERVPCR